MNPLIRLRLLVAGGLVAWLIPGMLLGGRLSPSHPWIPRIGLSLIGLAAAGVILWLYRGSGQTPKSEGIETDIDHAIQGIRAKLRVAPALAQRRIARLPVVIVLGPPDSAKTTTVLNAGLDVELVAGVVHRGDAVVETETINAWLANGTLLVEAGGRILENPPAWRRLAHYLPAGRWRAAFTGKPQAPRVALLCVSVEELLKPDAAQSLPARARELRDRLGELSAELRVRLPVYVVLTKLDRVPFFADYVRSMSQEEARDVLGMLLPATGSRGAGWAERTQQQLGSGLGALFESLASRRLLFLGRERGSSHTHGVYEFPREFRKLAAPLTQFLLELGKPSQLQVSPFVRGYYFTGVRAIPGQEAPAAPAVRAPMVEPPPDATGVFAPRRALVEPAPYPAASSSRRIPQWVFLERFFPRVLQSDKVALGITRRGHGVNLVRRALLGTVLGMLFIAAIGLIVSAGQNRRLTERTRRALEGTQRLAAPAAGGVPAQESLEKLDSLRAITAVLSAQVHERRPWSYRWGLSQARRLYPAARGQYFAALEALLLTETREGLRRGLLGLPTSTENVDYGETYNRLKGYLILVDRPDSSSSEFMGPVLDTVWRESRPAVDPTRLALIQAQFDFFGDELRWGKNGLRGAGDSVPSIRHAREILNQFKGIEPVYGAMIRAANRSHPGFDYGRTVPEAQGVLSARHPVPGAFTKAGWRFMVDTVLGSRLNEYNKTETWVLGDYPREPLSASDISALRARYQSDYVGEWRDLLASGSVEEYRSFPDAEQKLRRLTNNPSPLLRLFQIVSDQTSVLDSTVKSFEMVHKIAPADPKAPLDNEVNRPYMGALRGIYPMLGGLVNATGPVRDQQVADLRTRQADGIAKVQEITSQVAADTLRILASVQRILEDPLRRMDRLDLAGASGLNGSGASLCSDVRRMFGLFPFNPQGTAEVDMDQVSGMFGEGSGRIWTFATQLGIQRQGRRVQSGTGQAVTSGAMDFFQKAARITTALYETGPDPGFRFGLRAISFTGGATSVTVRLDATEWTWTPTDIQSRQYNWNGKMSREVQVRARVGGRDQPMIPFGGPWALFKFLQRGENWQPAGDRWTLEVPVSPTGDARVTFDLYLRDAENVFARDYFASFRCPAKFVQ